MEEVPDSAGPGNVVLIEVEAEHAAAVFASFGKLGVKAEEVAMQALRAAQKYLAAGVPVEEHLADQLLVPLGIGAYLGSGGGTFRTTALSNHAATNLEILRRFLDLSIQVDRDEQNNCTVSIAWR